MASILIVDDELSMRQFLTHLFHRDGHAIRTAENGRQAMELLREQPADVVISDVKMPDMGGIELLRAARELQPNIEIIMMTAFANEATAHEAFLLGAFDFVHKPFDNELLKEKVARACFSLTMEIFCSARATFSFSNSLSKGLWTKSKAPSRNASCAVASLANAVIMITSILEFSSRAARSNSMPPMSGIFTSDITTSAGCSRNSAIAWRPFSATRTVWPSR